MVNEEQHYNPSTQSSCKVVVMPNYENKKNTQVATTIFKACLCYGYLL